MEGVSLGATTRLNSMPIELVAQDLELQDMADLG